MNNSPIILIVDDEQNIADLLETNLQMDGFSTLVTSTCAKAWDTIQSQKVDLILLDVMLPDGSGVDLCRRIKSKRNDIPILMLSALGQSADRVHGLKAGANDYLPKPFDLEELILRISNLLTHHGITDVNDVIQLGQAQIDFQKNTIKVADETYTMSQTESLFLKYLANNKGKTLSRAQILNDVWGYEHYPNTRTIDNYIANFRKYIEKKASNPKIITTVRGIGYRMN